MNIYANSVYGIDVLIRADGKWWLFSKVIHRLFIVAHASSSSNLFCRDYVVVSLKIPARAIIEVLCMHALMLF